MIIDDKKVTGQLSGPLPTGGELEPVKYCGIYVLEFCDFSSVPRVCEAL